MKKGSLKSIVVSAALLVFTILLVVGQLYAWFTENKDGVKMGGFDMGVVTGVDGDDSFFISIEGSSEGDFTAALHPGESLTAILHFNKQSTAKKAHLSVLSVSFTHANDADLPLSFYDVDRYYKKGEVNALGRFPDELFPSDSGMTAAEKLNFFKNFRAPSSNAFRTALGIEKEGTLAAAKSGSFMTVNQGERNGEIGTVEIPAGEQAELYTAYLAIYFDPYKFGEATINGTDYEMHCSNPFYNTEIHIRLTLTMEE